MQTLLDVILPVFLVIGFGYVAVWKFAFPIAGIDGLMKFAQSFAIPCLLFQAIANIDLQSSFDPTPAHQLLHRCSHLLCRGDFGLSRFPETRLGRLYRHRILLPILKFGPVGPPNNRTRIWR